MEQRKLIVASAQSWIGTPYLHQASLKGAGADCLGLLRGVWREVIGPEPEAEALGDVLLFRMRSGAVAKHLGLVAQVGATASFVHAYSGHSVVETALSDPWRRKIYARFQFPEGA